MYSRSFVADHRNADVVCLNRLHINSRLISIQYYIVAGADSATNTGQGDLKVTFSRGYRRKNYVIDGGFEGSKNLCFGYCWTQSDSTWTASNSPGGYDDAFSCNVVS